MNSHKKESLNHIPLKNYIYLFIILLGTIFAIFYIYKWYDTYKESKLNISIMSNYLQVINYNELDNYITENKDAVIYVSVLGDEQINKFESTFKNTILDNNLRNTMLYLDITTENRKPVEEKLQIDASLPYIVVYTNGEITDTYSIQKNKYNTKKIIKYLNRIGATEND